VGLFEFVAFTVSDAVCESPMCELVSLSDLLTQSWDRLWVSVKKRETVNVRLVLEDSVSVFVCV
jgi:hypothetical protein